MLRLDPELAAVYREIRAIPLSGRVGRCVGWDFPCEMLHAAITAAVRQRVSPERISRFIANYAFMHQCHGHVDAWVRESHARHERNMKNMKADVDILVAWFREMIGPDWVTASRARAQSALGMVKRVLVFNPR